MLLFTVMGIISVCNLLAFYIFSPFLFLNRVRIALGTVHMLSLTLYNLILLIHPQLIRLEIRLSIYVNFRILCSSPI